MIIGGYLRAVLEFDLPEESDNFRLAQMGPDLYKVVFETFQELRTALKHGHAYKTADEALEAVQSNLRARVEEMDISFDQIS